MNRYSVNDEYSYSLGMSLTIEALLNKSNYVKEVYLSNKVIKNDQLSFLLDLCKKNNINPIYDDRVIEKFSLKENCFCIGYFKKYDSTLNSDKHIILYEFDNYGDLGTVLRSAVSFNFKDVVLIKSDIDYFDPRCIRASMGSIFHTNIVKYKDFNEYFSQYNNQKIFPLMSKTNTELKDILFEDNYSIVFSKNYNSLDKVFENGFYIKHSNFDEISLPIRISIVLNYAYSQNLRR